MLDRFFFDKLNIYHCPINLQKFAYEGIINIEFTWELI